MDTQQSDKALRAVYNQAVAWQENVAQSDSEKMAYLSAVSSMIEQYDPINAYKLYSAINKLFFGTKAIG